MIKELVFLYKIMVYSTMILDLSAGVLLTGLVDFLLLLLKFRVLNFNRIESMRHQKSSQEHANCHCYVQDDRGGSTSATRLHITEQTDVVLNFRSIKGGFR